MESRADEFLGYYKELEQLLKTKVYQDVRTESVVAKFTKSRLGAPYQDILNAARDTRNLLQHQPKYEGEYLVQPSEELVNGLKEVVDAIENPRKALDFSQKRIYTATPDSKITEVTAVMNKYGYSHVPVYENRRLIGVFSVNVLFSYMVSKEFPAINESSCIGELRGMIGMDQHRNEYYEFVDKDTLLIEADALFETSQKAHKRLAVIYITENGKPTEYILGMLTPWDVLSAKAS